MKTIQDHLKECDRSDVIGTFLYKYAFDYRLAERRYEDMTIGEYIEGIKKNLLDLIEKIISIKPVIPKDDVWIMASIHVADWESDIDNMLLKKSEILDRSMEWIPSYGYEFMKFEEAAGFFVADTYLTQYNLTDLLADFLYEITWTGWNQEGLEETIAELDEAEAELKTGEAETVSCEELFHELGADLEKQDENQKSAWKELMKSVIKYNAACKSIEIEKLRNLLEEGK